MVEPPDRVAGITDVVVPMLDPLAVVDPIKVEEELVVEDAAFGAEVPEVELEAE